MSKISPTRAEPSFARRVWFDEFSVGEDLRRNGVPLEITPKAFAVLRLLVARAGELVSKEVLWAAVWPRVVVTDAALTVCMAELRRVLGDDARQPRYIATVPKRGYRFLYPVATTDARPPGPAATQSRPATPPLVGRARELAALHDAFAAARRGERRLAFVIGEPGIGKTSLLRSFAGEIAEAAAPRVIHGQCSEHFGTSEPYLPLLDGIGQACRAAGGDAVRDCLVRHAPLWLAQLPSLVAPADSTALQSRIAHASPERMLRELAEAVEELAGSAPLALFLEDLHWSDHATLDWLGYVVRRQAPAHLLIVATLRDAAALRSGHPLRELVAALGVHPRCSTVAVSRLESDAVRDYLEVRLGGVASAERSGRLDALSHTLQARTDGNPLFLANVLDDALAQAAQEPATDRLDALIATLAGRGVPPSLQQFIALQLEQLGHDERALLEAAAVAGEHVAPPLVAAALEIADHEAEDGCDQLARETGLLRHAGTVDWPDGTLSSRYAFKHSLYRELLYARQPAGRIARMHRAIGTRLERAHGDHASDIAAELAVHFGRGHSHATAARHALEAGRNALARGAYADAEAQFRYGLAQLEEASDTSTECERDLQLALGKTLIALRGWASPGAEQAFARAYHLGRGGDVTDRFMPLWGMAVGAVVRADFARYQNLQRALSGLADESADPLHRACACWATAQGNFHVGEFTHSVAPMVQALAGFDSLDSAKVIDVLGTDFGVFTLSYQAHLSWILGDADAAAAANAAALARARASDHPFSQALAHAYAALLYLFMDDTVAAAQAAATVIAFCSERGFEYYRGWGEFVRGWVAVDARAAERDMLHGLESMQSGGARLRRAYYLALLAQRRARNGDQASAREALAAARDELAATHERCWEGEIDRIEGALFELSGDLVAAESSYRRAVEVAHRQQALGFELRAALALAALLEGSGRVAQARELLAALCARYGALRQAVAPAAALEALARLG